MTYRQAKDLLSIGDSVFIVEGGQVLEQTVKRIHKDALFVDDGFLYFDEVGETWFLTRKVASEKAAGRSKYGN